jgi:hypothetical protein
MTYSEKLRDPRWQKKRLETLERYEWHCSECDSQTKTLHVHHRYYISGRLPWEYPDFALVVLCAECHEERGTVQRDEESGEIMFHGWELMLDRVLNLDSYGMDDDELSDIALEMFRANISRHNMRHWLMHFILSQREEIRQ